MQWNVVVGDTLSRNLSIEQLYHFQFFYLTIIYLHHSVEYLTQFSGLFAFYCSITLSLVISVLWTLVLELSVSSVVYT